MDNYEKKTIGSRTIITNNSEFVCDFSNLDKSKEYADEVMKRLEFTSGLFKKLNQLEQLDLPNGAKGAVWLDEVIEVIEKHLKEL